VSIWPAVFACMAVTLVAPAEGRAQRAVTEPPGAARTTGAASPDDERVLMLVRRRGGVAASLPGRLRRSSAVEALAEVSRTQFLLRRSRTAGGRLVDRPRRGYAIPLDTLVVDPRAYARVTNNDVFRRLRRGRVLLPQASARLRGLQDGDRLTLAGGRIVVVAGVVADRWARGAEVIAATADVPRRVRRATAVVVATRNPAAVADAVPDDGLTRVGRLDSRPDSATTAGSITRPVQLKRNFGEFAVALPYGANWIDIDPRWVRRNIVTRDVPILGAVTCHRRMIGPLRRALARLERRRLARLIDPGDYAGCFAARRIAGSGSLSLHAWGLAVDINASQNPQGRRPRQDARIVRAFEGVGFRWGGRWPTAPDGMHFEWHGG
jgi:D-alanyl-D-alanine carboxypeptidase-like protein